MKKKNLIAVAIILALLLVIGGMIAYFTDTDTKTNVFTLGDVDISISETFEPTDAQGLLPGDSVNKAPSIKNDSTTTPAYVFAEVIVPCYDADPISNPAAADTPLYTFTANSGWTLINTPAVGSDNTITYVYAYGTSSAMTSLAAGATTSAPVFNSVTVAPTLTSAEADTASATPNIVVNAYGIQTKNLGVTAPADIFALFTPSTATP